MKINTLKFNPFRSLLFVLYLFACPNAANAQFDGIEVRAGINATRPAEGADGKPFQFRTGWNSAVAATWEDWANDEKKVKTFSDYKTVSR